ncbi:MAG: hypothetical protein ACOZQL_15635 [Myxococcota bacterium]
MLFRSLLAVVLFAGCGAVSNPPDAGSDAGLSADAGGQDSGVPDAGGASDAGTDAGSVACAGGAACVTLNENQCATIEAGQGGCTRRFSPRCVERGSCTGQSMSTCTSAGACRWSGTICVAEPCGAMTTEADCLNLRCTWATLFSACDGSGYSCDVTARTLSAANPAQACSQLGALGLACTP